MSCVICGSFCKFTTKVTRNYFVDFCEIFSRDPSQYDEDLKSFFSICIKCSENLIHISGVNSQLKLLNEEIEIFKSNVKDEILRAFNQSSTRTYQDKENVEINVERIRYEICKDLLSENFNNDSSLNINSENNINPNVFANIKCENEEFDDHFEEMNYFTQHQEEDSQINPTAMSSTMNDNEHSSRNMTLKLKALKNKAIVKVKKLEDMSPIEIETEMSTTPRSHLKRNCKSYLSNPNIEVPKLKVTVSKNKVTKRNPKLINITPNKPRKNMHLPCGGCEKTLSNNVERKIHWKEIHNNEIVKCTECPKMYRNAKDMRIHRQYKHIKPRVSKMHVCPICGKLVKLIAKHMETHEDRSVECEICNKVLKSQKLFQFHYNFQHNETFERQTCVCPTCGKTFLSLTNLKIHEKQVHDKNYNFKCEMCDYGSQNIARLRRHMKAHTEPSLRCPEIGCERIFRYPDSLKNHLMDHTGQRPFQCSSCPKRFKTAAQREVHQTTHTPEITRATCDICGKKFTHKLYLKLHLNWHKKVEARGNGPPKLKPRKSKANNF